jgi:probable phosphoglycerate mutase
LAARWIGLPWIEAQHFSLGTASNSILGYDPRPPQVPVIEQWNLASVTRLNLLPGALPLPATQIGDT